MKFDELMDHEAKQILNTLDKFDHQKNGTIQTSDIGNLLRSLYLIPSEADIIKLKINLDPQRKGQIKCKALLEHIAGMWPSNSRDFESRIWQAFLTFDKNDSGKLPADLFRRILTEIGTEPIPEKEVKKIIRDNIDPKDNTIQYGALIRLWMK